jgi:UDP-N-acetylmuramyl pentapeptide phosphotransferase/UDP-N-acetylglucosamine-1-phosphate transferase
MFSLPLLNIVASFLVAAFITWYSIPKIIKVVKIKNLCDKPGDRKIHKGNIPTLGGIGIFGGFFIAMLLFVNGYVDHLSVVCASLMFIFFMGEKDDLINMPPKKKLVIELSAAALISIGADLRFTSLHGFLGIEILPIWASVVLSIFVIVFIMNAFNLIDGIDGLAAGIGILAAVVFGTWFFLTGDIGYTVICAAIAGALIAFLPYNFHKGKLKIFMGDTGSLTVGFLLAVLAIRFNENNLTNITPYNFNSAPAIILSILILPLFDTIRVFIIRLRLKKNPFYGDNNHLHHRLIRIGFNHTQTALILVGSSGLFVIASVLLDHLGTELVTLILIVSATAVSYLTLHIENKPAFRSLSFNLLQSAKSYYKKVG